MQNDDPSSHTTRRRLVALGAAAAATTAVALSVEGASKTQAATGQPLLIGELNEADAGSVTELRANVSTGPGLQATNSSGGAVHGISSSSHADGVLGINLASEGFGVQGRSDSSAGYGVFGRSAEGIAVGSRSDTGNGVDGFSVSGTGVHAVSPGGVALHVEGTARFSTTGSGTIAAGSPMASVANAAVTANSHITVTLTGDPGQAPSGATSANGQFGQDDDPPPGLAKRVITVQWLERQPGSGFVVHMTGRVRTTTPFTYLIVEP